MARAAHETARAAGDGGADAGRDRRRGAGQGAGAGAVALAAWLAAWLAATTLAETSGCLFHVPRPDSGIVYTCRAIPADAATSVCPAAYECVDGTCVVIDSGPGPEAGDAGGGGDAGDAGGDAAAGSQ
jgi:hypothetical protein